MHTYAKSGIIWGVTFGKGKGTRHLYRRVGVVLLSSARNPDQRMPSNHKSPSISPPVQAQNISCSPVNQSMISFATSKPCFNSRHSIIIVIQSTPSVPSRQLLPCARLPAKVLVLDPNLQQPAPLNAPYNRSDLHLPQN